MCGGFRGCLWLTTIVWCRRNIFQRHVSLAERWFECTTAAYYEQYTEAKKPSNTTLNTCTCSLQLSHPARTSIVWLKLTTEFYIVQKPRARSHFNSRKLLPSWIEVLLLCNQGAQSLPKNKHYYIRAVLDPIVHSSLVPLDI